MARMVITAANKVIETIQFKRMVLSRIVKHLVNLSELSEGEWIAILWAEVLLNGANVFRAVHKYPACTRHRRILGQRIGHNVSVTICQSMYVQDMQVLKHLAFHLGLTVK